MIKVFGVANHSPEAVIRALSKSKVEPSDIGILPVNYHLSERKPVKHKVLMFLTVPDFMHNLPILSGPKYSEAVSVVFANPMKLNELVGIQALDFEPNPEYAGFGFTLKSLDLSKFRSFKGSAVIERRHGKYLEKLVNHVQQGSLLNPLMTFIYTLPSVMQGPVKTAILKWLYLGRPDRDLDKVLDDIEQGTVTVRVRQRLKDILISEVGKSFQNAFKTYREAKKNSSPINLVKVAKTHSVSDYELRYILSVIDSEKRSGLYIDSFDKARNRKLTKTKQARQ